MLTDTRIVDYGKMTTDHTYAFTGSQNMIIPVVLFAGGTYMLTMSINQINRQCQYRKEICGTCHMHDIIGNIICYGLNGFAVTMSTWMIYGSYKLLKEACV